MTNPLKPGFAALRQHRERRRRQREDAAHHAVIHALGQSVAAFAKAHNVTTRTIVSALHAGEGKAHDRAVSLEARIAALEAEVARLTTHHPAPSSDLSGLAAWSSR